jgi:AbrB family looped-hinge helix DNA binding protein
VPMGIRRRMGLSAGDRVDFLVEDGGVILRLSRPMTDVFDKYIGALAAAGTKHTWVRKPRTL